MVEQARELHTDRDVRKPAYLLEHRSEGPLEIEQLLQLPGLRLDAAVDLDRYKPVVKLVTRGMGIDTFKNWFEMKKDGLKALALGSRASNETRDLAYGIGEYGKIFHTALQMAELQDHAKNHGRLVKANAKTNFIASEGLHGIDPEMIIAGSFFPDNHDSAQMLRRFYNLNLPEGTLPRDPRALHEEEGAILMKLLTPQVAQSLGISMKAAGRLTTYAAVMIWCHDKHSEFADILSGDKKAYDESSGKRVPFDGQTLYGMLKAHQLDMFSLSESQWLSLFREVRLAKEASELEKSQKERRPVKLPIDPQSTYGLLPFIEASFPTRLEEMQKSDTAVIDTMNDVSRAQFLEVMYTLGVVPDLMDMGMPPDYAVLRKLCANAHPRAIFDPETDYEDAIDEKRSDLMRSDWARTMIEYILILKKTQQTRAWEVASYRELMINTLAINMTQSHTEFMTIMRAMSKENFDQKEKHIADAIDGIVQKRIKKAVSKASTKQGYQIHEDAGEARSIFQKIFAFLKSNKPQNATGIEYAESLKNAVDQIERIGQTAVKNIIEKPHPQAINQEIVLELRNSGKRKVVELDVESREKFLQQIENWNGYTDEQITKADENFHKFFDYFCSIAGVGLDSDSLIAHFMENVRKSLDEKEDFMLPQLVMPVSISLGDEKSKKTIHNLNHSLNSTGL